MTMSVGGVEFPNSVIDLERRVAMLEMVIDHIANGRPLPANAAEVFNKQSISDLQKKYPALGIKTK